MLADTGRAETPGDTDRGIQRGKLGRAENKVGNCVTFEFLAVAINL
jgi:hypothetical protein